MKGEKPLKLYIGVDLGTSAMKLLFITRSQKNILLNFHSPVGVSKTRKTGGKP